MNDLQAADQLVRSKAIATMVEKMATSFYDVLTAPGRAIGYSMAGGHGPAPVGYDVLTAPSRMYTGTAPGLTALQKLLASGDVPTTVRQGKGGFLTHPKLERTRMQKVDAKLRAAAKPKKDRTPKATKSVKVPKGKKPESLQILDDAVEGLQRNVEQMQGTHGKIQDVMKSIFTPPK